MALIFEALIPSLSEQNKLIGVENENYNNNFLLGIHRSIIQKEYQPKCL